MNLSMLLISLAFAGDPGSPEAPLREAPGEQETPRASPEALWPSVALGEAPPPPSGPLVRADASLSAPASLPDPGFTAVLAGGQAARTSEAIPGEAAPEAQVPVARLAEAPPAEAPPAEAPPSPAGRPAGAQQGKLDASRESYFGAGAAGFVSGALAPGCGCLGAMMVQNERAVDLPPGPWVDGDAAYQAGYTEAYLAESRRQRIKVTFVGGLVGTATTALVINRLVN